MDRNLRNKMILLVGVLLNIGGAIMMFSIPAAGGLMIFLGLSGLILVFALNHQVSDAGKSAPIHTAHLNAPIARDQSILFDITPENPPVFMGEDASALLEPQYKKDQITADRLEEILRDN